MKSIIFIFFLFAIAFRFVDAQTSETISELTPVPTNVGKFVGRLSGKNLKFNAKIELIDLPDGKKGVVVTIKTNYNELPFEPIGGKPTARMTIYGRITSKDKKTDGFFEEKLVVSMTNEELAYSLHDKYVVLRKVFVLPESKYQIGIIVRDHYLYEFFDFYAGDMLSIRRGIKIIKFQIP